QNCKVLINVWLMRLFRMHDEGAQHSHHFLHRHMRVIEEGPLLVKSELVDEAPAGFDGVLACSRRAVHVWRDFKPVPVHGERLREMIVDDDSNAISLTHLNRWSRSAAVESPQIENPSGHHFLLHWFSYQVELFYAAINTKWQVHDVWCLHGDRGHCWMLLLRMSGRWMVVLLGKDLRCGK